MAAVGARTPPSALFEHHERVIDAVTGGEIDSDTELARHYVPICSDGIDTLLRDLTGITKNAASCRLILEDGTELPSGYVKGCQMSIRFKDLWLAPTLLLECEWKWAVAGAGCESLKLILKFHFNSLTDGVAGIKDDFHIEKDIFRDGTKADEMIFTCREAACEGFNWVAKHRRRFKAWDTQLYDTLVNLIEPATEQKVRLRFSGQFREGTSSLDGLLCHLPGGTEWQLPSLSHGDWAAYLSNGYWCGIRSPEQLMQASVKHLMVPTSSSDTFDTLEAASIELAYSAHCSYTEQKLALELWAETTHYGVIYKVGEMAFMAVRFNRFARLGTLKDGSKFRLPDGLHTKINFTDFRRKEWKCTGKLVSAPIRLPDNQGVFAITSHSAQDFDTVYFQPENRHTGWVNIKFDPHISKFTYCTQMETARRINVSSTARWHQIILNQRYSDLRPVDLLTGKAGDDIGTDPDTHVEAVFQSILNSCPWSPEQIQALKGARKALGALLLISGPAGTGKTDVAQAFCEALLKTGCRVLALGPQNSNMANWVARMKRDHPDINPVRIFPASTEIELKNFNKTMARFQQPGHVNGASTDVVDLSIALAAIKNGDKYAGKEFGLQEKVIEAALEGNREKKGYIRDSGGCAIGEEVNFWSILRDCMEKESAGEFDWDDQVARLKYEKSYKACKADYLAGELHVCTTTGNARCSELVESWGRGTDGIVVIVDEASRDSEIDTLAFLLGPQHIDKIRGVILLGDEQQLEPINTSPKAKALYSPFPHRKRISLFARLKRQGFPCVELKEQHRMNHYISRFVFKNFYPAGMRDASEMMVRLRDDEPGLRKCLRQFLCDTRGDQDLKPNDGDLRLQYLQVKGKRIKDRDNRSSVVREHIQLFFNEIFWYLHEYYKENMADNVIIIAAYGEAVRLWKEAAAFMQRKYKLGDEKNPSTRFVPEIVTIDSSQGREADVVFVDCSVQSPKVLGFVDDDRRMNVAFSRARKVRWLLGGDCSGYINETENITPAYIRYYQTLASEGRVLDMKNSSIQEDGSGWIDGLKKKEVKLEVRYQADDADSAYYSAVETVQGSSSSSSSSSSS